MSTIVFDGQQEGERILYEIHPDRISKYLAITRVVLLALALFIVLLLTAGVAPAIAPMLRLGGFVVMAILIAVSLWWNGKVYDQSKTFITDRRIMRFEMVSPFFQAKRSLFWNEALKAKGYAPNMLYRSLGIGVVEVTPHMDQHEDIIITDCAYFEDIANYIDKILYTFKQTPSAITDLKPFIPKPRWQRSPR